MLAAFKLHIEKNFPELLHQHFLLACSGGIDSMVLTELCAANAMQFSLAHCNFGLRGESSDNDEKLVVDTAKNLDVAFYVKRFDTVNYAESYKVSIQMAARNLRYAWFSEVIKENSLKGVITAHHADDNVETFFINLLRGTGVAGLTGIPIKTEIIARPLLVFSKTQIQAYALEKKIIWRDDHSNTENKYLRNKIRHQVVPHLKAIRPDFITNFKASQQYLRQTAQLAEHYIEQLKSTLFIETKTEAHFKLKVAKLKSLEPLEGCIYGLFKEFGFKDVTGIIQLLSALSGKEIQSQSHRIVRDRDHLLLSKIKSSETKRYSIKNNQSQLAIPLKLQIKKVTSITTTGPEILYVPESALGLPVIATKMAAG